MDYELDKVLKVSKIYYICTIVITILILLLNNIRLINTIFAIICEVILVIAFIFQYVFYGKKISYLKSKIEMDLKGREVTFTTQYHGTIQCSTDDINILMVKTLSISNVWLLGLKQISGVELQRGDSVLLRCQEDLTENGIYEVNKGYWKKLSDFKTKYTIVYITEGQFINSLFVVYFNDEKTKIDKITSISLKCLSHKIISFLLEEVQKTNIEIKDLRNNPEAKDCICK